MHLLKPYLLSELCLAVITFEVHVDVRLGILALELFRLDELF
jgi:hypothetical protein